MRRICFALALLATMAAAGSAMAEELGGEGQFAVSADASVSFNHRLGDFKHDEFVLRPALDYFVIDGLSIGASVTLGYAKVGDADTTIYGIGPRVGYAFTITDQVAFWPKVGLEYLHMSVDYEGISGSSSSTDLFIFAPFTFAPVDHFFMGIGPHFNLHLSEGSNDYLGISSTVGGYW
ncbi:MAG: outer membrane beta-barrel protein [Polyangiaceae bacterium]|nr:outer membrane beta-barrel protein [Polyangiaceae bacterium]